MIATEIMVATAGIRNLIREQEIEQIPTLMQTGAQFGMRTMDKSLKELVKNGDGEPGGGFGEGETSG